MNIKTFKLNLSYFNIFFFSLGGYYALLILVSNFISNDLSRLVTVPIRFVILLSILYLFYKSDFNRKSKLDIFFVSVFSFIYIFKVAISAIYSVQLYMSSLSFLLYFLSFFFIPFVLFSMIKVSGEDYERIFKFTIFGCVLVSILTYFFYGQLLGTVNRITDVVGKDDNFISPLALSYVSVLGITLCFSYLVTRRPTIKYKIYLYLNIFLCLIPFYLGASRGAVLAFIFTIGIYFLASKGISNKIKITIAIFLIGFLFFIISSYMGTSVFDRVLRISSDINTQNASAVRLYLWESAILQFLNSPFFGGSLQLDVAKHHPHNILIEVLMSTGIFGFIPFLIFIIFIFIKAFNIIREQPEMFWVTNIFFIGFIMSMFSGAIWGSSWLAIGAALISGFNFRVKKV